MGTQMFLVFTVIMFVISFLQISLFLQESKISEIESQLESSQYELERTKTQKEELMKHYEQVIIVQHIRY